MSEFKGTPGPWVVEDNEYVMDEDGHCIGAFGGIVNTDKDNANAILCAAAPDLLEALQDAEKALFAALDNAFGEKLANKNRDIMQARAAIAKALGK